jgi:hypothetical protein
MRGWTPERRLKQSLQIRQWRPWDDSTGPKTPQGKAVSSRNAYRGGVRSMLNSMSELLREQGGALDQLRRGV